MGVQVRPISADEMRDWVATMHVAFHSDRPTEAEAEYRLGPHGQDLQRTLGAFEDDRLVGTYESFPTELTLPGGGCVLANAISSVSVLPTHHRRGLLRRMITQDLHAARERGEAASILIAAEYPIYGRFGFGIATEHATYRLEVAYARFQRSAPGRVSLVTPQHMRTVAPGIFDRVRHGHAGQISRRDSSWDRRLDLVETPWRDTSHALRCALYAGSSGEPEGYLLYRVDGDWQHGVPTARLAINELMALTGEAYLGLWRYAAEVDLVGELSADMRPVDEGLPWLLDNARKALQQTVRGDFLWLRSLDTPRLLAERRYCTEGQVILQIDDPLDLAGGRFAVEGSPDGATCRATSASPDLTLSMRALGAIALGGAPLSVLQHVGEVQEERPGAVVRAERMFHEPRAPWCSTFF